MISEPNYLLLRRCPLCEIDHHPQKCCLSASVDSDDYKGIRSIGTPVCDGASRLQHLHTTGYLNEAPERIARLKSKRFSHYAAQCEQFAGKSTSRVSFRRIGDAFPQLGRERLE